MTTRKKNSTISQDEITAIRAARASGLSFPEIAQESKVGYGHVWRICNMPKYGPKVTTPENVPPASLLRSPITLASFPGVVIKTDALAKLQSISSEQVEGGIIYTLTIRVKNQDPAL